MKKPLLLTALLAGLVTPLLGGCVLLAGAGAGLVISQEVLKDQEVVAHLQVDVDRSWEAAQEVMHERAFEIVGVQDYPRQIEGKVGQAQVVVQVEAFDLDRSIVRVSATKFMVNNVGEAERMLDAIVQRLAGNRY